MLSPNHPHHHTMRFYVLVITLIIGGIFIFLFINNGREGLSLTSAFIGGEKNVSSLIVGGAESSTEKIATTGSGKIDFSLSFDQIPEVKQEAKLEGVGIEFTDLKTRIDVNGDRLELNNIENVNLQMVGFVGDINFNEYGVSLSGDVKKLDVNGIALSSKEEIKINFEDLDYKILGIKGLELKELEMPEGDGILEVKDKLNYAIKNEKVSIYKFVGQMAVKRDINTQLVIGGVAEGVNVAGDLGLSLS